MKFENHPNYNCEIVTDTGNTYRVFSDWLHNEQLDHWQGWECAAGASRLYIDKNFNVWSGECRNDNLGNALTGFEVLEKTVCQRLSCTSCTDDLVVAKKKITYD